MTKTWQLQDAKNKLSEVIDEALHGALQIISRRGKPVAVLISMGEFNRLKCKKKSLTEFFAESPMKGLNLDLTRQKDLPRKTDL